MAVPQDATKLTERLLELCEKDIRGTNVLSITNHFRPLKRLLEDKYEIYSVNCQPTWYSNTVDSLIRNPAVSCCFISKCNYKIVNAKLLS